MLKAGGFSERRECGRGNTGEGSAGESVQGRYMAGGHGGTTQAPPLSASSPSGSCLLKHILQGLDFLQKPHPSPNPRLGPGEY